MDDSFSDFVRAELPGLTRFARLLTHDPSDAADLAQDSLIKLGMRWRQIDVDGNPAAYARKTVVRLASNMRRSKARERERLRRVAVGSQVPGPANGEMPEWLVVALTDLPLRQRAAVALRFLEDQSDEAIADILGCSQGTVRSQISRGLARLRASAPHVTPE